MEQRDIVVTGAATGIGRAAVSKAVEEGAHVFASVRKEEDAIALKEAFADRVTPLRFDVTDGLAVRAAAAQVGVALGKRTLAGLVNNAGIAVAGPLLYLEPDELRRQFETNLFGVHVVTQAFAPLLGVDPGRRGLRGRIVMISSVAGRTAMPFTGAYSASKHALEGYSAALRRELMLFGVDVIVVAPGAIVTPIWGKRDEAAEARYAGTAYAEAYEAVGGMMTQMGQGGLPASAVGELIWRCLTEERPRTRYGIQREGPLAMLAPLLPQRLLDRVIAKRAKLEPAE